MPESLWDALNRPHRIVQVGPLTGLLAHRQGWVRLFGWGVAWKDVHVYGLRFSERNGHWRRWQVGPWSIKVLKRRK